LHAKIEKVAIQNSWKQLKTLNYIYFENLGSCKKKLQKLQKLALVITYRKYALAIANYITFVLHELQLMIYVTPVVIMKTCRYLTIFQFAQLGDHS